MNKFLNGLKFNWVEPYNDEAEIDGFWMFDALSHPHEQWQAVTLQSNPRYYTTWGIQQLLNGWKTNILRDVEPPHNVFVPTNPPYELRLYQEALRLETCYDLDAYRQALDNLIEFNSEQIGDQFMRIGHANMDRYEALKATYMGWRSAFDLAFS